MNRFSIVSQFQSILKRERNVFLILQEVLKEKGKKSSNSRLQKVLVFPSKTPEITKFQKFKKAT